MVKSRGESRVCQMQNSCEPNLLNGDVCGKIIEFFLICHQNSPIAKTFTKQILNRKLRGKKRDTYLGGEQGLNCPYCCQTKLKKRK